MPAFLDLPPDRMVPVRSEAKDRAPGCEAAGTEDSVYKNPGLFLPGYRPKIPLSSFSRILT